MKRRHKYTPIQSLRKILFENDSSHVGKWYYEYEGEVLTKEEIAKKSS